jgi:signal transduction histidine kinase
MKRPDAGPSSNEIKLKLELDRVQRELIKLKKLRAADVAADVAAEAIELEAVDTVDPIVAALASTSDAVEADELRRQLDELTADKRRLSRLYFSQLEENRRRQQKLRQILDNICDINAEFDLDALLLRLAETLRACLGFRVVLIRLREPGTRFLKARTSVGIDVAGCQALAGSDVSVEEFLSWLKDEFKVSRSYFISHSSPFNGTLPRGYTPGLGTREEWEWHENDVLLSPLFNRHGELLAYISVDDPIDRLVPSRELIELLEIFGNHAAVAIENARLYSELEGYARQLQAASRHMQEMHTLKSNFLSAVSHELRTPLTAMRGSIETLMAAREGEVSPDQLKRLLAILDEESRRLARLVESVLDLNRFDSGTLRLSRQPIDLAELLEEIGRLIEPAAQIGQVRLKVESLAADTRLDGNRDQIRQLALHLGNNAVKFTPPGGEVVMRVGGDEGEITLQVEDTGIGIPEHSLDRIFERFYQVDSSLVRRYGGAGLGLAICKSIVEWHGGRIEAKSTPGRGSCFTVALPRRASPRVLVRPGPSHEGTTGEILRLAIEMVADVMNAGVVSLLTPEPDGTLSIRAAFGLDENVVREARIRPGSGVAGWVAENRRPVCVSGAELRAEVEGSGRGLYRSRTFLSVPLEGDRGLLGVLNVTDPTTQKPFDAEDCHLLLHLAERVTSAWEQALKPDRNRTGELKQPPALRDLLDPSSTKRASESEVARLARAVARELKLTESEGGVVSFAATLSDHSTTHRCGRHASESNGAERSVRPLETVGAVCSVVRSYREWWDGTGYPEGLAATAIPIGGRILAVVDAWMRFTRGRAGKAALSAAEAIQEIQNLKGRQFDPEVVDAFARVVERAGESSRPKDRDAETTDARR